MWKATWLTLTPHSPVCVTEDDARGWRRKGRIQVAEEVLGQ